MIPKSGYRFSEKIMLNNNVERDDDSKKSQHALAPAPAAPAPELGPVVQPFADFPLEAAVGRIVKCLAAERVGKIVLARECLRRRVIVFVSRAVAFLFHQPRRRVEDML